MLGSGQTGAYTALSLIAALWGSYPAFAKLALVAFPPLVLVVLRCSIASAFLCALLFRRGASEFTALRLRDLGPLAFLGFVGIFISTGGTYLAIAFTTASSAVLLQPATPVMVVIGARVYLGEHSLSDTPGSYLFGGVWLALSLEVYGRLRRLARPRPEPQTIGDQTKNQSAKRSAQ